VAARQRILEHAKAQGFQTAEEYILWQALDEAGIKAEHNVHVAHTELDLMVGNLVIEVGYLDDYVRRKRTDLERRGYDFIYVSNLEVRVKPILRRTVERIVRKIENLTSTERGNESMNTRENDSQRNPKPVPNRATNIVAHCLAKRRWG
jgi:hypothetical protein